MREMGRGAPSPSDQLEEYCGDCIMCVYACVCVRMSLVMV